MSVGYPPPPTHDVVKLTVNLPSRVWQAVLDLAAFYGVSKTEALRRAISTEHFRMQVEQDGGRLLVERDGKVERVVFPY